MSTQIVQLSQKARIKKQKKVGGRTKGQDNLPDLLEMLKACKQYLGGLMVDYNKARERIYSNNKIVLKARSTGRTKEIRDFKALDELIQDQLQVKENIDLLIWVYKKGIWLGDMVRVSEQNTRGKGAKIYKLSGQVVALTIHNGCITMVTKTISGKYAKVYQTRADYDVFFDVRK